MPPKRSVGSKNQGTLVERVEDKADAKVRQRRQLSRRKTDEQVDRSLREHFAGWSTLETHGTPIDGMTLVHRLKHDKRESKESGTRLGSSYWADLRQRYDGEAAWSQHLKVKEPGLPVADNLVEALRHASNPNVTKRTKAPLTNFLAGVRVLNQKEICGLMRYLLPIRPSTSPGATSLVVEFMKCVVRLKLSDSEGETIKLGHNLYDEALVAAYASMKREGISTGHFMEVYGDVADFVLDVKDVMRILEEKTSWGAVGSQLKRVVASSQLGAKMFGYAASEVCCEEFGAYLKGKLAALPQAGLALAMYNKLADECIQHAATMADHKSLLRERTIVAPYRWLELSMQVQTAEEEVHLRLAAHFKARAAGGHLPALLAEQAVLPEINQGMAIAVVEEACCKEWRLARLACNDMLAQQSCNAELMRETSARCQGVGMCSSIVWAYHPLS